MRRDLVNLRRIALSMREFVNSHSADRLTPTSTMRFEYRNGQRRCGTWSQPFAENLRLHDHSLWALAVCRALGIRLMASAG